MEFLQKENEIYKEIEFSSLSDKEFEHSLNQLNAKIIIASRKPLTLVIAAMNQLFQMNRAKVTLSLNNFISHGKINVIRLGIFYELEQLYR